MELVRDKDLVKTLPGSKVDVQWVPAGKRCQGPIGKSFGIRAPRKNPSCMLYRNLPRASQRKDGVAAERYVGWVSSVPRPQWTRIYDLVFCGWNTGPHLFSVTLDLLLPARCCSNHVDLLHLFTRKDTHQGCMLPGQAGYFSTLYGITRGIRDSLPTVPNLRMIPQLHFTLPTRAKVKAGVLVGASSPSVRCLCFLSMVHVLGFLGARSRVPSLTSRDFCLAFINLAFVGVVF